QQAVFDLDTVLGAPADRVVVRFTACDRGLASIVEALVDDVAISRGGVACFSPEAQPRLRYTSVVIGDSATYGSSNGNNNGIIDPGEHVKLPIDLTNDGNAAAHAIQGTLSIVRAPVGVTVSDPSAPWPDMAIGAVARTVGTPPHFEIFVPGSVPCGTQILLALHVTYDGPS